MTVIRSDAAPPLDCSTGIYSNSFKTHNITVSEYMLTVHKFWNENNSFMKLKKLCSIVAGIRQQQNQRSSFIDGTMIYGFNKAKEDSLRTGELGTCSYVIYFLFFVHVYNVHKYNICAWQKHRYNSDGACIEIKCVHNINRFSKGKRWLPPHSWYDAKNRWKYLQYPNGRQPGSRNATLFWRWYGLNFKLICLAFISGYRY